MHRSPDEDKGTRLVRLLSPQAASAGETEDARELRQKPRAKYMVEGRMEVVGVTPSGGGITIHLRDVSELGAALRCAEIVPASATVRLSITAPCGAKLCVHGAVVRLTPVAGEGYDMGIRFFTEQPLLAARRVEAMMYGR